MSFSMGALRQDISLLRVLTVAQIKARYRKTVAGFLWVTLNPILTFGVQASIFKHILKIDVERYFLFLLSGILPWTLVTSTITMTVSCFVTQRQILTAFSIKPQSLVLVQVIDNFINFLFAYLILLTFLAPAVFLNPWFVLCFAVSSAMLFLFTYASCLMLATLHTRFRDTQYVIQFLVSLAYFATPIFYPIEFMPAPLRSLMDFNVLYLIVRPFRSIIWDFDLAAYAHSLTTALAAILAVAIPTYFYWRGNREKLYFRI